MMAGKVMVAPQVLAGINAVLRPGRKPLSPALAGAAAREAGYRAAAEWIEDNPEAFIEGLRRGFELAEPEKPGVDREEG
jgi:hypothetical protein